MENFTQRVNKVLGTNMGREKDEDRARTMAKVEDPYREVAAGLNDQNKRLIEQVERGEGLSLDSRYDASNGWRGNDGDKETTTVREKIMSNKEGIRAMGELAQDASESAAADYDEIKQLKSGS